MSFILSTYIKQIKNTKWFKAGCKPYIRLNYTTSLNDRVQNIGFVPFTFLQLTQNNSLKEYEVRIYIPAMHLKQLKKISQPQFGIFV